MVNAQLDVDVASIGMSPPKICMLDTIEEWVGLDMRKSMICIDIFCGEPESHGVGLTLSGTKETLMLWKRSFWEG